MQHDLGTLRSLLAMPPSAEIFDTIMDDIDVFDDEDEVLLAYLAPHIARWPAEIVRAIPDVVFTACSRTYTSPWISLCNTLHADTSLHLLDDGAFTHFLSSPTLRSLATLHIAHYSDGERLVELLQSPHLTSIHTLDAREHPEQLLPIATHLRRVSHIAFTLDTLDLSDARVTTEQLIELILHSPLIPPLRCLRLPFNAIDADAIEVLANARAMPRLEVLDLRHNPIGLQGASALAMSTSFPALRWLDLRRQDITDEGAAALAHSSTLPPQVRRYWSSP